MAPQPGFRLSLYAVLMEMKPHASVAARRQLALFIPVRALRFQNPLASQRLNYGSLCTQSVCTTPGGRAKEGGGWDLLSDGDLAARLPSAGIRIPVHNRASSQRQRRPLPPRTSALFPRNTLAHCKSNLLVSEAYAGGSAYAYAWEEHWSWFFVFRKPT